MRKAANWKPIERRSSSSIPFSTSGHTVTNVESISRWTASGIAASCIDASVAEPAFARTAWSCCTSSRSASRFHASFAPPSEPSSRERRPRAFAACTGFHGFFFAYRAAASANSLSARGSICFTSASTCSGVGAARDGLRCRAQSISWRRETVRGGESAC